VRVLRGNHSSWTRSIDFANERIEDRIAAECPADSNLKTSGQTGRILI
jgi:hypothetical protein